MRKIRWGVLGTAHIAEGQTIPGMQNTKNCELYAIAGRSLESLYSSAESPAQRMGLKGSRSQKTHSLRETDERFCQRYKRNDPGM